MSKLLWWAYLHSNGQIQIKRFFPAAKNCLDDLEYAKEEMLLGNDFIAEIMPNSFEADSREEAANIATKYFRK